MFGLYFISYSFLFVLRPGAARENLLPTWLANNPAFQHPNQIHSNRTGSGSISAVGKGSLGWLIACNDEPGHGIQLELTKVSLDPDAEEFLLIAPWPTTASFKQIKLFTGRFRKPPKQLRIPNTKSFQVVYSASRDSSEMALKYRRYGTSLEVVPPPTDNPVDKKKTVFEIQLRGKAPTEYLLSDFSSQFKSALRSVARRYANAHQIPFNDSIPTQQMVLLRRVSFCPLEWPERDTCASLEHSIFVSGVSVSDGDVKDYQLDSEHLKSMWSDRDIPELSELGVTVFLLPRTSRTVLSWSLFVVFMAAFSLLGSFLFWRSIYVEVTSKRKSSAERGVKKGRRPKLRLGRQQRIPSFMHAQGPEAGGPASVGRDDKEEVQLRERFGDSAKAEDSSQLPIKNYLGSILFGSNRAFGDDEEGSLELRSTSLIK